MSETFSEAAAVGRIEGQLAPEAWGVSGLVRLLSGEEVDLLPAAANGSAQVAVWRMDSASGAGELRLSLDGSPTWSILSGSVLLADLSSGAVDFEGQGLPDCAEVLAVYVVAENFPDGPLYFEFSDSGEDNTFSLEEGTGFVWRAASGAVGAGKTGVTLNISAVSVGDSFDLAVVYRAA